MTDRHPPSQPASHVAVSYTALASVAQVTRSSADGDKPARRT